MQNMCLRCQSNSHQKITQKDNQKLMTNVSSPLPPPALTSLTGLSVYMAYSAMVFRLALRILDQKTLEGVHIVFGWSLTLAWLSCGSEFLTSAAFLLACRTLTQQREEQRR